MMYTRFREPFSGFSHLSGAFFSLIGMAILVMEARSQASHWYLFSYLVFGLGMLAMFTSSALYHLSTGDEVHIKNLKRIDHIMIFLFIAATYTPICLIPLHGTMGWQLLALVWFIALTGVAMKLFWLSAPRWLSTLIYLAMGWCILLAVEPASTHIPEKTLGWILAGGLFYSVGAAIYAFRWPDPLPNRFGFHEIWHLFVMAGVFCHFYAIAFGLSDIKVQ